MRWIFATCTALLVQMSCSSPAAQPAAREYDVKATLLFNFCQFVDWPRSALVDTNAPFVIGILGRDPFGAVLDDLVKNERAHGKPIRVKRFGSVEEALGAHILFISRSEQGELPQVLSALRGRPILTVGDGGGRLFTSRGGMISLATENETIKIRVNLGEARAVGLTISAKLLRLAQIVETDRP